MPSNLNLRVSDGAIANLADIYRFTDERWGPEKADEYAATLQATFIELCQYPSIGRRRSEIPRGMRVWPVGRHLIIYLPTDEELQIVRVVHIRQDLSRIQLN
jgi:toxin ParE1/3/4